MSTNATVNELGIFISVGELLALRANVYLLPTGHLVILNEDEVERLEGERDTLSYIGDEDMLKHIASLNTFNQWRNGDDTKVSTRKAGDIVHIEMETLIDWATRMEVRGQFRTARRHGGKEAVLALYEDLTKTLGTDGYNLNRAPWLYDEKERQLRLVAADERYAADQARIAAFEGAAVMRKWMTLDAAKRRKGIYDNYDERVTTLLEDIYGDEDEA